jgi:hypothetical protein
VPSVTYAEVHRELCLHWRPWGESLKIVDSRRREWLIYDANTTCGLRYEYPLGSPRAIVRVFWREDHVREWRLADGTRDTDPTTVRRQLRYSRRVDFPEHTTRSMGRRFKNSMIRAGEWGADDASMTLVDGHARRANPTQHRSRVARAIRTPRQSATKVSMAEQMEQVKRLLNVGAKNAWPATPLRGRSPVSPLLGRR